VRKLVAFCLLLITPLTLTAQNEVGDLKPKTVKLERGQVLDLSLVTPFDSGHAHVGDAISFKLERGLKAGGTTILPRNWPVHGRITKVVRAGKNCKTGRVRWKLEPVTTADGRKIKVQPIAEYLAKPRGVEVDRVSLVSTGAKIGRATEHLEMAPAVVLFSPIIVPWFILLAIGMSGEGDCHGTPGLEESVRAGARFYGAVSQDARLVQAGAAPRSCDSPETVTDSPTASKRCD
jgi:hypothetical protein